MTPRQASAFLDTCVLYPIYLCDTLLRLAETELYQPLWSAEVLGELERVLIRHGITEKAVNRRITAMQDAFPEAAVDGYGSLIPSMTNHPKDRHVLAAAVHSGSTVLVTFNLDDFPVAATSPFELEVRDPDDFLLDILNLSPGRTLASLTAQVSAHRREPHSVTALMTVLERCGVPAFAAEIRRHVM